MWNIDYLKPKREFWKLIFYATYFESEINRLHASFVVCLDVWTLMTGSQEFRHKLLRNPMRGLTRSLVEPRPPCGSYQTSKLSKAMLLTCEAECLHLLQAYRTHTTVAKVLKKNNTDIVTYILSKVYTIITGIQMKWHFGIFSATGRMHARRNNWIPSENMEGNVVRRKA